jgi:hypothetical protein
MHPVSEAQVRMETMGFRLEHKTVRQIKRRFGHGTEAEPQFAERYRYVDDTTWPTFGRVEGCGRVFRDEAWLPCDYFAVVTRPCPRRSRSSLPEPDRPGP